MSLVSLEGGASSASDFVRARLESAGWTVERLVEPAFTSGGVSSGARFYATRGDLHAHVEACPTAADGAPLLHFSTMIAPTVYTSRAVVTHVIVPRALELHVQVNDAAATREELTALRKDLGRPAHGDMFVAMVARLETRGWIIDRDLTKDDFGYDGPSWTLCAIKRDDGSALRIGFAFGPHQGADRMETDGAGGVRMHAADYFILFAQLASRSEAERLVAAIGA